MDPGPSRPPFFPIPTPAVPNIVPSVSRDPEPQSPKSRTYTLAATLPSKALGAPDSSGPSPHDGKITDCRGAGIVEATRPLYGNHRPVYVEQSIFHEVE